MYSSALHNDNVNSLTKSCPVDFITNSGAVFDKRIPVMFVSFFFHWFKYEAGFHTCTDTEFFKALYESRGKWLHKQFPGLSTPALL